MMKKTNLPKTCMDCQSREKGIFCDLHQDDLLEVSQHKISNQYKKGQTIFMQDNPGYGLYCISQGKIKLLKVGSDGKETLVRIASDGDIIGHRSLFIEENNSATATALEDSVVCFLDKKYIIKAIQERPSIASHVIKRFSKELGAAEDKIFSMYQKNVRERLAELFLILKESYGVQEEGRIKLDIKLSREEMASMIGTANETLIRFISELKDEGIIQQEGKTLYILKEKVLIEFANLQY